MNLWNKLRSLSVKWRVFAGCVLFSACILAVLWVLQIWFLEGFYHRIKENQLKDGMAEVTAQLDSPDLQATLETIAREQQVCIVVTDEMGFVLYSADGWQDCVLHQMNPRLFRRAFTIVEQHGGTYMEQVRKAPFGEELLTDEQSKQYPEMFLYGTIALENGVPRLVLMNTDFAPVAATVDTLRLQLIWLSVLMLLLAAALALVLSLTITRPLKQMQQKAKKLATGDYTTHFSEDSYEEARALGKTLNYAATELSKVEQLQKDLIANISHDLRTPLTMITGYAEIMRDLPGENTPENVQVIIDEARRMQSLVNDVLDISKLQSHTVVLEVAVFSITEEIQDILKRYQRMTDYHFTFIYQEEVYVKGDRLRLSQVICNFLNNAITHTGSDHRITITQDCTEHQVKITVADTGQGIPTDKLQDIWERYYKVDKTHKRAQVGTGLGLSIVKSILNLHPGATYGVQSEEGKGSQFWFALKREKPPTVLD